jgi:hypothetical protein
MLGDLDGAAAAAERAWADALRDPPGVLHGFAGVWLAFVRIARGDLAGRAGRSSTAGASPPTPANEVTTAHCRAILGRIDTLADDHAAAAAHLRASLPMHLALGDSWGIALDLEWLSALAGRRGLHADFARFAGAVDALRERVATRRLPVDAPDHARHEAAARAALGAGFDRAYDEGRGLEAAGLTALADALVVALGAAATGRAAAPDPDAGRGDAPGVPAPDGAAPAGSASDTGPAVDAAPASVAPPLAGPTPAAAPAPLRVLALGGLQVCVGDRPVDAAAWGSARPRELLAYLVAHPDGRTKSRWGSPSGPTRRRRSCATTST